MYALIGFLESFAVGFEVGFFVFLVGFGPAGAHNDGAFVGDQTDGAVVGKNVGTTVGDLVGALVGVNVGEFVGASVGIDVGAYICRCRSWSISRSIRGCG